MNWFIPDFSFKVLEAMEDEDDGPMSICLLCNTFCQMFSLVTLAKSFHIADNVTRGYSERASVLLMSISAGVLFVCSME